MIRAAYVGLIMVLGFGLELIESEAAAIREDTAEKTLRIERAFQEEREPPAFQLQTHPTKPPRCRRVNAIGQPLMQSYAIQADGGEWLHECHYGVRT